MDRAIAKAVAESLDGVNDEDAPGEESLKRISRIARKTTGWQKLKQSGPAVLPAGQCTAAFDAVTRALVDQGVFVVTVVS